MKISLNWVKEFTDVKLPVQELVEKIGAQLGAVEEVIDLSEKYQGVVVAKVVQCEKHPNADKLSLCLIDDGGKVKGVERTSSGYVQVVCGAPNVKAGMLVAWLPPGATVPASHDKEPFVLEARELRGKMSNGMLASASELGISDDHSGIVELDEKIAKPGDDFAEVYKLRDTIIDVENKMFTHRPDCFGILGVAREIAGITHQQFTSPEWYLERPNFADGGGDMVVEVKNELPELVPRFMAAPMKIAHNGPSPLWLQTYLSRVGLRPINLIVDLTNYYMYLTGQPTHAYDYDKLLKLDKSDRAVITVRKPKKGEKLRLLNDKEIEPRDDAIMIASAKRVIGVGGVMGGADTEVDENTRRIVIEVANFDMYSIRRTSMEHGLFTDAVTRFNKGQSPYQSDRVLARMIEDIERLAGGHIAGVVQDNDHTKKQQASVRVGVSFINERLGLSLSATEMKKLLENVEFDVEADNDELTVKVPFWRTDIEIPEDVVEEVGRLYGYDHLPLELPKRDLTPAPKDMLMTLKSKIRDVMSRAGANEVLTYSFVHGNLLEKVGQDLGQAFRLSNAISPDLQYYRLTLTPSLLEKVHPNIKGGYDKFAIFEIGKTHNKSMTKTDEGVPEEIEMVSLVYAAKDAKAQPSGVAYYQAKSYLDWLAKGLGLRFTYAPITDSPQFAVTKPFDLARSAYVTEANTGVFVGIVGEITASARRNLKLPAIVAAFEIGTTHVLEALEKNTAEKYVPIPRFPKVEQDISLKVPVDVAYGDLAGLVEQEIRKLVDAQAEEEMRFSLTPIDIYQREDDEAHKNITLRLTIASYQRTMKAEEVNAMLDTAAAPAHKKFNAERL